MKTNLQTVLFCSRPVAVALPLLTLCVQLLHPHRGCVVQKIFNFLLLQTFYSLDKEKTTNQTKKHCLVMLPDDAIIFKTKEFTLSSCPPDPPLTHCSDHFVSFHLIIANYRLYRQKIGTFQTLVSS